MSAPVIEAVGLTKRYGRSTVVDGVDLTVEEGEVVGLLGPNGAGKTTTILMLLGLTEPSAGSVKVLGMDPLRDPLGVKRQVGYLPDAVGFYDGLTGAENLRYTAALGGFTPEEAERRIETALSRVELSSVGDQRVATYSRGMRQRLGLAELVMRDSRVVILDEPTSGLDPRSTEELLEIIRGFAHDGMTVLISSHLLDVVQSICTRVALFNRGRLGFVGTVEALADRVTDGAFRIDVTARDIDLADLLGDIEGINAVSPVDTDRWEVSASHDVRPDMAVAIVSGGGSLVDLSAHRIGLGEAYSHFFEEA